MNLQDLAFRFSELNSQEGYSLECQVVPGEVEVLQITVEDFDELPVYLSVTDTQILCITYLWREEEIDPAKRGELLETLLEMNIPMPLSSFSRIGDQYVAFGALAINSNFEDITHEVITLCENSVEALTALEDYLK